MDIAKYDYRDLDKMSIQCLFQNVNKMIQSFVDIVYNNFKLSTSYNLWSTISINMNELAI